MNPSRPHNTGSAPRPGRDLSPPNRSALYRSRAPDRGALHPRRHLERLPRPRLDRVQRQLLRIKNHEREPRFPLVGSPSLLATTGGSRDKVVAGVNPAIQSAPHRPFRVPAGATLLVAVGGTRPADQTRAVPIRATLRLIRRPRNPLPWARPRHSTRKRTQRRHQHDPCGPCRGARSPTVGATATRGYPRITYTFSEHGASDSVCHWEATLPPVVPLALLGKPSPGRG